MFLLSGVSTFYKAVPSSSKGFGTVEGLCGTLISLRPGVLGYLLKISSHVPGEVS
jgi:hypothetical protein